jgi:hypothetical protein
MLALAAPLVKWDDVLKIFLVGIFGAVGVVVVYGFLMLAVSRARSSDSGGVRSVDYAIAGLCGLLCVGAVALGIYATVNKPKSSQASAKGKSKIAMTSSAPAQRERLVA